MHLFLLIIPFAYFSKGNFSLLLQSNCMFRHLQCLSADDFSILFIRNKLPSPKTKCHDLLGSLLLRTGMVQLTAPVKKANAALIGFFQISFGKHDRIGQLFPDGQ